MPKGYYYYTYYYYYYYYYYFYYYYYGNPAAEAAPRPLTWCSENSSSQGSLSPESMKARINIIIIITIIYSYYCR